MRKKIVLQVALLFLVGLIASSICGYKTFSSGLPIRQNQTRVLAAQQALEHHVDVPFHYQEKDYYCGPACLEMVFDYYGQDGNQSEIADVARTIGEPYDTTYPSELLRAAHFSNLSTSKGNELPGRITGYSERDSGFAASEADDWSMTQLKSYIDQGRPLIVLTWYSISHASTHYRVVVGYNETHVFLHDPWNKLEWGGSCGGPDVAFSNFEFSNLWSVSSNWALCVSPWSVNVSSPVFVRSGAPFQVGFTVTYPRPVPRALPNYAASSCNATIKLPENLGLAQGEQQRKAMNVSALAPGANGTVGWMVTANDTGQRTIRLDVEGLISGSAEANPNYSSYDYADRIGASVNLTLDLREDNDPPMVEVPSRTPEDGVQSSQEAHVSVTVTDLESGIQSVALHYSLNNDSTWSTLPMDYDLTSRLYVTTIPGQPGGTRVRFKIVAQDNVGNVALKDGTESDFAYQVAQENQFDPIPLAIVALALIVVLLLIVLRKRFSHGK
jgi:hypothetical protein